VQVKDILQQVLRGIAYLHDKGSFHRTLDMLDILVSSEGEVKICNFEIARRYDSSPRSYTPRKGALSYLSPELLLGKYINIFSKGFKPRR
jgi:serine/threonine protein kinase